MKMLSGLLLSLLLLAVLAVPALGLEAVLPPGYETETRSYPVLYLMPEAEGAAPDPLLAERLRAEMDAEGAPKMLLVSVEILPGQSPADALGAAVSAADAAYRTLPDPAHRGAVGIGAGGYLAYDALLADQPLISAAASVRGWFGGENHPWQPDGEALENRMRALRAENRAFFDGVYTYLDAPVDDAWTDLPGSTDDLGSMMILWQTGRANHEFTVRPGEWTDGFLMESCRRVLDRFGAWMGGEAVPAEKAPSAAVPSADSAPVLEGDRQILPLDGAWFFRYTGAGESLDAAALKPEDFSSWDQVAPGVGNWTKGYGNISEENVTSGYGPDYFDFFIIGNGYYARTFTLPAGFETEGAVLSMGCVDDRCQLFLNGTLVGSTGFTEAGAPNGESTWAQYSAFEVPAGLLREGENTLVLRAWNDTPYGAGGWYEGPVGLYSRAAFEALMAERNNPRFFETTFPSALVSPKAGESVEQPCLIYLPEGYEESAERYPVVYLLHQFNSDHTSYRTDHVDALLDEGIAQGLFGKMIVVIPNSSEESWWTGKWERMVTEELIPWVDSHYRTIPRADSRLTAGCSMGGQGAFGIGLRHPELFSGAVSFFGAFSYGGAANPNAVVLERTPEELSRFSLYFICGNQDSYGFGVPAIELHQKLLKLGVPHRFFIENGGHDSAFYLPFFQDAFAYMWDHMGLKVEPAAE